MSFLCSYTKIYPGLEFGNELITIYYNKVFCLSFGDIDMKKMNSPKLEVIQFNTEDVIVTSGVGTTSSQNIFYSTRTYFAEKGDLKKAGYEGLGNFFYFHFIPKYDSYTPEFSAPVGDKKFADVSSSYYYTWYDAGWFTDNLTKDYYNFSN